MQTPQLPQPGEVLTHEQAAFFSHLAGMHAKSLAESTGANPAAARHLASAARQLNTDHYSRITSNLKPLTMGMLWAIEKVAELFRDAALEDTDDLAISLLIFSNPEGADELIEKGNQADILYAARQLIKPLTIPQLREASAYIAMEMSALTAQGKHSPAGANPPPANTEASPPFATQPINLDLPMAGPSPSSNSFVPNTESPFITPSGATPSKPPLPSLPVDPIASATSPQA